MTAAAAIDRVVHHSVILELTGPRPPALALKTRSGEESRMNAAARGAAILVVATFPDIFKPVRESLRR